MHSKIFQITRTRVSQDDYLNESTLAQGDNSFFDYCGEIDEAERKFHIDNLVNNMLPKGMFELISEDTIRYIGGAEKWQADFVAGMRSKAEAVTPDKVLEWIGPVYQLGSIPPTGSTWTRRACNPMPNSPTSSCGRCVSLNPARCSISAESSTIISNPKYGTMGHRRLG